MKNNALKNAVSYVFLLMVMATSSIAQAWVYATGYPQPAVAGVGSGVLGASTTAADRIRFTCPSTVAHAFSFTIRTKNVVSIAPYAYVEGGGTIGYFIIGPDIPTAISGNYAHDYIGGNSLWSQAKPGQFIPVSRTIVGQSDLNGPNYVLRIAKSSPTTTILNYELGVRCLQSDVFWGYWIDPAKATAAPLSATYLQNQ